MDLKEQSFENYNVRHPWETTRLDFFTNLGRRYLPVSSPKILDCGAGDCWFSFNLANRLSTSISRPAKLTLVDIHFSSEIIKKLENLNGGTTSTVFTKTLPEEVNDLVLMLDVLEHIEDDEGFLNEVISKTFDDKTIALISVPAIEVLFGRHDKILGHHRRYSSKKILSLLKRTNLRIIQSGFLFSTLIPARILWNMFSKGKDQTELQVPKSALVESMLKTLLKFDMNLQKAANYRLPGLTWWCVCQKSGSHV